jgi:hypothetical protein
MLPRQGLFPVVALVLALTLLPAPGQAAGRQRSEEAIKLTGVHVMLNQAYQMILEGSGLVILGEMDGSSATGKSLAATGRRMLKRGRSLLTGISSGAELNELTKEVGSTPRVKRARELADTLLEAADNIDRYLASKSSGGNRTAIDQLFMLLNHGMKMSTDGANMIMKGRIGPSNGASDFSQKHGRAMMRDGRVLIVRLSTNDTMKELEGKGVTSASDPRMDQLNRAIIKSLRIIDTLARL